MWGRYCVVFVACHSELFCVGGMEHSDSESDFELHGVDPVVDGFSDDFSQTSSEEQLGKRPTVMMWIVAMTPMVQTFMMLMMCNLLMMPLKLKTKVLGKNENGELKQILRSAFVCVDIFMNVKTRRQLFANSRFNQNKCVSTWHKT